MKHIIDPNLGPVGLQITTMALIMSLGTSHSHSLYPPPCRKGVPRIFRAPKFSRGGWLLEKKRLRRAFRRVNFQKFRLRRANYLVKIDKFFLNPLFAAKRQKDQLRIRNHGLKHQHICIKRWIISIGVAPSSRFFREMSRVRTCVSVRIFQM